MCQTSEKLLMLNVAEKLNTLIRVLWFVCQEEPLKVLCTTLQQKASFPEKETTGHLLLQEAFLMVYIIFSEMFGISGHKEINYLCKPKTLMI